MTKRCKRCRRKKPDTEFYKDARVKDGLYGQCRTCWQKSNRKSSKAAQVRWLQNHPGERLTYSQRWRAANRKRSNSYSRKWARNNREKVRARTRRWAANNRERIILYAENRRALAAKAPGHTTPEQLKARIAYYGNVCWVCGDPFNAVDHVIALNCGGSNWPSNLRPICKPCNSSKGDKHPTEFLEDRRAEACA